MIDLHYLKQLDKENYDLYLKNSIQYLIEFTNDILNYMLYNTRHMSRKSLKKLTKKLDFYLKNCIGCWILYNRDYHKQLNKSFKKSIMNNYNV
jgi:hypothetical protein